ncbi:ZNF660 isoform 2, partial [Pan troglodytes]
MRRKTRNFNHKTVKDNKVLTEGSDQESEKDNSQCCDPAT